MPEPQPTPVGQKFNRLTIIGDAPRRHNRMVVARCECGTVKAYALSKVVLGRVRSCGCLLRELPPGSLRHGHTAERQFSPTYYSWASMKTRCTNPKCRAWPRYGGRGIRVCERWLSFDNFLADMGQRPLGTSLDRIDNDRGYEPGNVRWATQTRQANNQRRNTILEFAGRRQTVAEWAKETGLAYNTIIARIHRLGWPVERALKERPKPSYAR